MRASGGAAISIIAELMDVHASLGVGVVAGDVVGDCGRGAFVGLLEGHLAGDLGVSSNNGDCRELVSSYSSRASLLCTETLIVGKCEIN